MSLMPLSCMNLPIASGVWSLFQEVEKYSSWHWLPASGLAPALVPTMILPAPVTTGTTAIMTFDQITPATKSTWCFFISSSAACTPTSGLTWSSM
jgi:hypothetical protein